MTPLEAKLRAIIEADGPMTVAEYMAYCLGDPDHGYYRTRDPLGLDGDFITAPEVSQMFGEIIGAWVIHTWRLAGAPSPARLVELGPGRGTLMADVLRVARRAPDFTAAISVHLVETSPVLTDRQRETLASSGLDVTWHNSLFEVPPGPILLVANEFFDALPIRQFARMEGTWRERVVGLTADRLSFGIGPGRLESDLDGAEGALLEVSPSGDAVITEVAARLREDVGAALIVDYGHTTTGAGETLQAVRNHKFSDPLDDPGTADLSSHVDFAALARRARAEGVAVHGPMEQGAFLLSLGLLERAGRLGAEADDARREEIRAAVDRLAGPTQMGGLFKVLALTRPGLTPPPFDPQV